MPPSATTNRGKHSSKHFHFPTPTTSSLHNSGSTKPKRSINMHPPSCHPISLPPFRQDSPSQHRCRWSNRAKSVSTCSRSRATSSLLLGVVGCDDYFLSWMGVKSRVGSDKLVDEDVGVLVEDLIGLAHLGIIEDVVLLVSAGIAPVVAALHRPLVDDGS
jgi:hypothetical protein